MAVAFDHIGRWWWVGTVAANTLEAMVSAASRLKYPKTARMVSPIRTSHAIGAAGGATSYDKIGVLMFNRRKRTLKHSKEYCQKEYNRI